MAKMTEGIGFPDLDWSSGAPVSRRFDDIYGARDGGLAESAVVFLDGCGLPDAWRGRRHYTVAELGFGTGTNILALWDLWRRTRAPGQRLHVMSIEGFPLSRAEVMRAHAALPGLQDLAAALRQHWPPCVAGWHRLRFDDDALTLDVAHLPVRTALEQWQGRADAWFLDGFAPAKNPDMWSDEVMTGVAARSAPGARLGTFTVAGQVRRGLQAVGFQVDKRPGYGRKRERLVAAFPGFAHDPPALGRIAVIGAGVAGAAVIDALRRSGHVANWYDAAGPATAASGNPAGLVTPRFDRGAGALPLFYAQAFRHACGVYGARAATAILRHGVRHLTPTPKDQSRLRALVEQGTYTPDEIQISDDSVWLPGALVVAPPRIVAALGGDTPVRLAAITALERRADQWWLAGPDAAYDTVVVACGATAQTLLPALHIIPTRGQISITQGHLPHAVSWGGYALPLNDTSILYGASHLPHDSGHEVRQADHDHNRDLLQAGLPDLAAQLPPPHGGRASVRAATRDRLPVCGRIDQGLYVLGGLGGRGLCMAPLLAEALVADLLGHPSPVARAVQDALSPLRAAVCHSDKARCPG